MTNEQAANEKKMTNEQAANELKNYHREDGTVWKTNDFSIGKNDFCSF